MIADTKTRLGLALVICLIASGNVVAAETTAGAEILRHSMQFIGKLTDFHVEFRAQELSQAMGADEITSVSTTARAWFKRPRMLLWAGQGPTWGSVAFCNGTSVTTFRPAMQAFTVRVLGADADAHMQLVESLYGTLPAALFSQDPWAALPVGEVTDAGREDVGTSVCRHIVLTGKSAAWDLWIAEGGQPLPLRIITRTTSAHRVTTTPLALSWQTGLDLLPVTFEFVPPVGAHLVDRFAEPELESTETLALESLAPELKLPMRGGGVFDLAAYKGKKTVVLDFWATWCHGCRSAMASMEEIEKKYKRRGVELVAVNVKETTAVVEGFLAEHKIGLNVAFDKDAAGVAAYKVRRVPQTWIIGKDGRVKRIHVGYAPELETTVTLDLEQIADPAPAK